MKKINSLILFAFAITFSFGQQGKYVRKSVSSLDAVWVKQSVSSGLNVQMLTDFFKFYIEVPRFDFNNLPKSQINNFLSKANASDDISSEQLADLMEETIVKDIMNILNDPEVKRNRGLALKSEADFNTFASTKAKSLGLTTDELKTLMNSAYIYLPYVTKFVSKKEGDDLQVDIEGGIIWWQLKVNPKGEMEVDKVLDATTKTMNIIDLQAKEVISGKKRDYKEYTFGDKKYETTPEIYVQGDAFLAFAKNLSVKTKELSDFKLQAQVMEKTKNTYGVKLGRAEGVHLDDGFFLVEISEDDNGNEIANETGFVRIARTGKNNEDPTDLSLAKKVYGEDGDIGSIVMEHPRLGTDLRMRLGLKSGLKVPKDYTFLSIPGLDPFTILDSDVTTATMLDLNYSYNLAPIINMSQTFLDFGFSVGIPNVKLTQEAIDNQVAAILLNAGLGISKKFWLGRVNVPFGTLFNYQSFSMGSSDLQYNISTMGLSLSSGFEFMINANTVFHLGVEMNLAGQPSRISVTYDGEEIEALTYTDPEKISEIYPDLFIGGWNYKIGIDYSLGELPFDIFGFLDPLKKY